VIAVSDGERVLATAAEAGDEPVLLARRLPGIPVVVGRDRAEAGAWALGRFAADVLLLDDGFQQRRLFKDVDVVCLDACTPWGDGGLFPGGSLREPPAALARADLLVLTHPADCPDLPRVLAELRERAPRAPVALATYEVEALEDLASGETARPERLGGRPVLAFAGIAVPERFLATLAAHGIAPRDFLAFPDHHPYGPSEVAMLEARARALGAEALVTTEKDAVRLARIATLPVWALRVRLRLEGDTVAWWTALEGRLAAGPARGPEA
jgi:tetraacyldisaccharide 4'-kinase